MKTWSEWEIRTHNVTLMGILLDDKGLRSQAIVKIMSAQNALQERVKVTLETQAREDGSFYFLDLPNGEYQLEVNLERLNEAADELIKLRAETVIQIKNVVGRQNIESAILKLYSV